MDEVTKSLIMLQRQIAELRLDLETCRGFIRGSGVTDEEFDAARDGLRLRWNQQTEPLLQSIRDRLEAERQQELLKSGDDDTKH
jgi:hypothetical protein